MTSFTRRTSNFKFFPYNINGHELERKESMRDLGVIYDSKLTFNEHVDHVCGKARRMMGFVMRSGKFFKDPFTFTTLYNARVRSNVEYATVIWNPHTSTQKLKIERVQHKFLKFVNMKCFHGHADDNINYAEIEKRLRLDTLEMRRSIADVKFTTKSFNGLVDAQTFLHHLPRAETTTTRSENVFRLKQSRTDCGKFSIANRLMTTFNTICDSDAWLRAQPDDYNLKNFIRSKLSIETLD